MNKSKVNEQIYVLRYMAFAEGFLATACGKRQAVRLTVSGNGNGKR